MDNLRFIVIFAVINICNMVDAEEPCSPKIKEVDSSILEIGGLITLDCSFITCDHVSTVVFKREGVAVYEALSKDDHKALGISNGYSLKDRSVNYFATRTNHILSIDPAILDDHSKWSCLVIDTNNEEYTSKELMINIYVKPKVEDILVDKHNFKPVTDQTQTFTCEVKDVHPKPRLTWKVNGEQKNGRPETPVPNDGLWSVVNAMELTFNISGTVTLECVMSAGDKQTWIEDKLQFNVKESAKAIITKHQSEHVLPNVTFTLTCVGSGYGHRLTWKKDSNLITNNDRYDIQGCDTAQYKQCTSTLKSKPVTEESECYKVYAYGGHYTCVAQLDPPYQSTNESVKTTIQISNKPAQLGTPEDTTVTRCTSERQIHCPVCAPEGATDTWFYGDTKLDKDDVDGTIRSNDLAFGMYKRAVKTSGGHINVTVHLLEGEYELCAGEKAGIGVAVAVVIAAIVGGVVYRVFMIKRKGKEKPWKFSRAPANEQSPPVDDKTKPASPNETAACESGPVYGNVNKSAAPTQAPPLEAIYSQVNKPKKGQVVPEPTEANDSDELHYADVEVIKGKNRKKKQSPKTPNPVYEPTEYASIDHTKSAKPDGP